MTVREYIERKNAIIKKHTGLTLVPEDQIIDMEPMELPKGQFDVHACPYCQKFLHLQEVNPCKDCPMDKAGNKCDSNNSSYHQILTYLNKKTKQFHEYNSHHPTLMANTLFTKELIELRDEYNKSNGYTMHIIKKYFMAYVETESSEIRYAVDKKNNKLVFTNEFTAIEYAEDLMTSDKDKPWTEEVTLLR